MRVVCIVAVALFIAAFLWFADDYLAPMFLDSRIERLGEKDLPKIIVEKNGTVYCRMKADDFRFPLPPGTHAVNPTLSFRGFDSVHGTIEAQFETPHHMSAGAYEGWVSESKQEGAWITAESISNGLLIKFEYFGDK